MSISFLSCRNFPAPLLLALCLAFVPGLAACGKKAPPVSDTLAESAWEQPALVDGDDGLPLTPTEVAALNSTGELDKNLDQAALADVAVQFKHFLHGGRGTMQRFSQCAQNYLGYTRAMLRQRGMPEELAYLAIVESGYNTRAVSPAGAAGAWQFMPATGSRYGLHQDWWLDERLDPYKSAEAAADYLQKLYGDFGDWKLALAAYNAGEGKVSRALAGTGARDFFELKRKNGMLDDRAQLKPETQQYVPRFLAVCKIMRNLETLGFAPVDHERQAVVCRLPVAPGTDLKALAAAVDMPWPEFAAHNAAHRQYVTHAGRTAYAYVPQTRQQEARAHLASNDRGTGWMRYTLGGRESWNSISRKSRVPVEALMAANPGVRLKAGVSLRLPDGPCSVLPRSESPKPVAAPQAVAVRTHADGVAGKRAGNAWHVVQKGDTLSGIAAANGMSLTALMAANGLETADHVRVGQRLRLHKPDAVRNGDRPQREPAAAAPGKKASYTVQAGDTLWAIARKHNISPARLVELNTHLQEKGGQHIRVGQRLWVSER